MAWSFNLNVFPSTGGKAIWELKEFLVGQGWNVARSGNGIAAYFEWGYDASTNSTDMIGDEVLAPAPGGG